MLSLKFWLRPEQPSDMLVLRLNAVSLAKSDIMSCRIWQLITHESFLPIHFLIFNKPAVCFFI